MAVTTKSSPSAGCPPRKFNTIKAVQLLMLVSLLSPIRAQEAPAVSMKVDVIAWGDSISGLTLHSDGKQTKVTAESFSYSTPASYSGPVIMEIHRSTSGGGRSAEKVADEDKDHEMSPLSVRESESRATREKPAKQGLALELEKRRQKTPSLVALAVLPGPSCRRAAVLLAPADGGTYTAYVIDDDPSKLPLGQLRIHNLSPLTLGVRCNGELKKELNTRDSFLAPGKNGQLIYEIAYKLGTEWKIHENNIMPIRATEQAQMFILKSEHAFFTSTDGSTGGFLQIVTLRRDPAQKAAAEAAAQADTE